MTANFKQFNKEPNKTISDYKGAYKISTSGKVFSIKRDRLLSTRKNPNGYIYVSLAKNGVNKQFSVHRLIAKTFINNDDPLKIWVNHIDGDKTNNNLSNLEWITPSENHKHAYKTGLIRKRLGETNYNAILKDNQITWIKQLYKDGYNKSQLAEIMNVSRTLIHYIIHKKYRQ